MHFLEYNTCTFENLQLWFHGSQIDWFSWILIKDSVRLTHELAMPSTTYKNLVLGTHSMKHYLHTFALKVNSQESKVS